MRAFGKFIGGFLLLLVAGYLTMVLLLPPAPSSLAADDMQSGRSAAVKLSEQAGALIGRKPASSARR